MGMPMFLMKYEGNVIGENLVFKNGRMFVVDQITNMTDQI